MARFGLDHFFFFASRPSQVKWQLMIAASHRRAGNSIQALSTYQDVHSRFPENVDTLKLLIRLCSELDQNEQSNQTTVNYGQLVEQYSDTLNRLEKSREIREQQHHQQTVANSRTGSRASTGAPASAVPRTMSREGSAATSLSSGGGSTTSGYNTSGGANGRRSRSKTPRSMQGSLDSDGGGRGSRNTESSNYRNRLKSGHISAIVDQVVEQLDSNSLNDRPTTSWKRQSSGRPKTGQLTNGMNGNNQAEFDDDLLLDTNLDDILPD